MPQDRREDFKTRVMHLIEKLSQELNRFLGVSSSDIEKENPDRD